MAPARMLVLDGRRPALGNQILDLIVDFFLGQLRQETKALERLGSLEITYFILLDMTLILYMFSVLQFWMDLSD